MRSTPYITNGEVGSTTVTTDNNGLVGVTTPSLTRSASFYVVFSTDNGIDVYNEGQYFDVTVTELSYSQEWTGVYNNGLKVGLGLLDGVESPVGLDIAMDLSKAITIKDEYNSGERSLTLDFANKGGDSLKLTSGLSAKLTDKAKAKLIGASAQATLSEQANGGLKIQNYDPTNVEHLKQIGLFAIVPVTYTSSVLWNKAFEKVVVDVCNTEAHEIGLGLKTNASVGSLEIAGIKSDIFGYSSASAWKWTDSYDYTENPTYTTSKSLKVSAGEGFGSGLGIESGGTNGNGNDISAKGQIGGYAYGYSVSNSKEISAKRPANSKDFNSISFKTYKGDESNYIFNRTVTDKYTTTTYSGNDAKNILINNPDLAEWANGRNPFINIQNAISQMNTIGNIGLVKETSKDKELAEFSFPIGVKFGVDLGINFGVSGEHSFSWCNATGALYNNTVYTTCVSDIDKNQVTSSANGLDDLFLEAANTVLNEMVKNIVTKSGRVSEGVQNDYLEVTGDHDVWVVVLNTIPSANTARAINQEESYTVLSLLSEIDAEDTITAFSSVGNPYEITVYTNDSQTVLVTDEELAENPVTLTFHYTAEMLESADAEKDAEVMLLRYDRENDIYICVRSAVQDKENMTVAADLTKSGEYILAVDLPDVPNIYAVTFDANGGITSETTMVTNEDGKLSTLPVASRENYSFNGWYTARSGGTKINLDTVFNQDAIVYAQWTYTSIGVPVIPNDPIGWYPNSQTVSYGITVPSVIGGKISVSPTSATTGSVVTITTTPDAGYALTSLAVSDAKGKTLELTDKGNGQYSFKMPNGCVSIDAEFKPVSTDAPWTNPFVDISIGDWYYDAVKFVNQNGLMNGVGNGLFAPNAQLSRAMLAEILYNKEGRPTVVGGSAFADVQPDAWYVDAVVWASRKGVVGGYGNGFFGPNDDITREQVAVMLYRYAGSPVPPNLVLNFSDAYKVSDWAQDAVRWAVDQGILNGKGNGVLDPMGKATRAEAAQMLKNYFVK